MAAPDRDKQAFDMLRAKTGANRPDAVDAALASISETRTSKKTNGGDHGPATDTGADRETQKTNEEDQPASDEGDQSWAAPLNLLTAVEARRFEESDVPPVIGRFAVAQARAMGTDANATIVSAVVAVAAMVEDGVRLCVVRRSDWYESARLWTLLIGPRAPARPRASPPRPPL